METKKTTSAGGVVLNFKNEVLVVSQRGDSWSLPKGHIDPGEDALTAAKREIMEESGIKEVDLIKPLGQYDRYKISKDGAGEDISELKTMIFFLFKTKEKVKELLTHPKDKDFFQSILKEI